MTTLDIGHWGEDMACEYLSEHNLTIITRNYHSRYGEIDIIAKDKDCIVFVEVKTRKSSLYGLACEYVTAKKQVKIINTARCYLGECYECEIRLDVIEIYYTDMHNNKKIKKINHIKNAFIS